MITPPLTHPAITPTSLNGAWILAFPADVAPHVRHAAASSETTHFVSRDDSGHRPMSRHSSNPNATTPNRELTSRNHSTNVSGAGYGTTGVIRRTPPYPGRGVGS